MGLERGEVPSFFGGRPGDEALPVGWGVDAKPPALGLALAPDFLLLKPSADGMPVLLGGCVCFPSSWAFEEKVGRPLDWIHAVVPRLNEKLGEKAWSFLTKMPPGPAWLRANWGLTASPEFNQHPTLGLPGLTQEVVPLAKLRENQAARDGLLEALKTMPDKIADYINLARARERLIELLG